MPGDVTDIADDLQARFEDAGFGIDGTSEMSSDGAAIRNFQFSGADHGSNVMVMTGDEAGTATVNYSVGTAGVR